MRELELFGFKIAPWISGPVIFLVWVTLGLLIKRTVFKVLDKFSQRTHWRLDDIFLNAASRPLDIMIFVWGAAFVFQLLVPPGQRGEFTKYTIIFLKISTIVALVLFVDKLLINLLKTYSQRVEVLKISQGLVSGITHGVVLALGVLILLDSMGVSITPIIASLGIGSLAVALALQPTLENLFSGFQIIADRPIVPGQFIKLESGEEGYVERIGWRSTWVRQLGNNMVIIPNKNIVNSRVINYYYPSKDQAVLVEMGVHYASDLLKVERVVMEVGKEVMQRVKGAVPEFDPFIRYHTFAESSVNFSVILRCQEFVDNYLVKHEFIKAVQMRFAKENITIPFPILALNTAQENSMILTKTANGQGELRS